MTPPQRNPISVGPVFTEAQIEAVARVLRSGWVGAGAITAEFEREFARYVGAEFAVGVASCTSALELALLASGIERGDEVITSAMTYVATVNAIAKAGATPVVVDIEPHSLNLDLQAVERALTSKTRAVIPVHLAGLPVDLSALRALLSHRDIAIIQDAAHAIETRIDGKPLGRWPGVACFSFGYLKTICTVEGGMVCTDDPAIAEQVKVRSQQGTDVDAWARTRAGAGLHYDVVYPGQRSRMTDFHACLSLGQLTEIDRCHDRRKAIWQRYHDRLSETPLILPIDARPEDRHAYYLFNVRIDVTRSTLARDEWIVALRERGVSAGIHYRSLANMSFLRQRYGWSPEALPIAQEVGETTLSLPLSGHMSDYEVEVVIDAVLAITALALRSSL